LKLIRKRLQIIKANRNSLKALVRVGLFGIKSAKLGSMRQTRTGATLGKYVFQSAFVATMPRGYASIFKRKDKTALPIHTHTHTHTIQGVPGGKDLTSGECSLGQTIPI
jgi:hypothetical protein